MEKKESPLRILYVEDNNFDREIFKKAFQEAGIVSFITECTGADEAIRFLSTDASHFDVAVIDHTLPGTKGLDLCKKIKEEGICLPLVLLTGTGSEEIAVEAMKTGIDDYIVKGSETHKHTLAQRIVKAFSHHEKEVALKNAEEKLRLLDKAFQTTNIGMTITDAAGKIIYVNPGQLKMHGLSREELIGREGRSLAPPEMSRPMTAKEINNLKNWSRDSINIRSNGETFPVHLVSDAVKDESGKTVAVVTACADITDTKKDEDSLKRANEELAKNNERLERFQKLTVGRELEMIKLKNEVNGLLKRLGEPKKYKVGEGTHNING